MNDASLAKGVAIIETTKMYLIGGFFSLAKLSQISALWCEIFN